MRALLLLSFSLGKARLAGELSDSEMWRKSDLVSEVIFESDDTQEGHARFSKNTIRNG